MKTVTRENKSQMIPSFLNQNKKHQIIYNLGFDFLFINFSISTKYKMTIIFRLVVLN